MEAGAYADVRNSNSVDIINNNVNVYPTAVAGTGSSAGGVIDGNANSVDVTVPADVAVDARFTSLPNTTKTSPIEDSAATSSGLLQTKNWTASSCCVCQRSEPDQFAGAMFRANELSIVLPTCSVCWEYFCLAPDKERRDK